VRYAVGMPQEPEPGSESVNPSHELDLVPIFQSSAADAEMEALNIQSILEAEGIPAVLMGASTIPVLEFQVQVPRSRAEEAERLIAEAEAAGPAAAEEAEAASEEST